MAYTKDSGFLLSKFSGKIGEVVLKRYKDKMVLSAIPDMSSRKLSPKQKAYNELMKRANVYAQNIIYNEVDNAYACKMLQAEPKQLYRVLVREFISKKGDKEKLLKFPYHQATLVRMEEIEQMGHS